MAWRTAFGNRERNSYAGVASDVGAELWTHAFAAPEVPMGPPVVSPSGYIWIVTVDTAGADYTTYLYCFNTDGTVKSRTTLQVDNLYPNTAARLSTLSNDVCLLPWTDRLKAYAPLLEGTNLTVDAADNTKVTPDGYTPATTDVGSVVTVISGAGWTPGDYTISAVSGGQWTLNASPAAIGTASGVWSVNMAELSWEVSKTTVDTSEVHFDAPVVMDDDTIYQAWSKSGAGGSAQFCYVTKLNASGSELDEWDTGYGLNVFTTPMLAEDGTGLYLAQTAYPITGSTHTYLNKFDYDGTPLWQYDVGLYVGDLARALPPSCQNSKVYFYARDSGDGFVKIIQLDASDGSKDWEYQGDANDYANLMVVPPSDAAGGVYGGHFLDPYNTPTCYKVEGAGGTEVWQFDDPDGSTNAPGGVPIVGNDGFALFFDKYLFRLDGTDGSATQVDTGINVYFQPALVDGILYVPIKGIPGSTNGSLRAYAVSAPAVSGSPLRGMRMPYPPFARHRRGRAIRPKSPLFWGRIIEPPPATCDVYFEATCMRAYNSVWFATQAYGAPTGFLIEDAETGRYYIVEVPIADIQNVQPGDNLRIRVRRSGANSRDTCDSGCALEKALIMYDEA